MKFITKFSKKDMENQLIKRLKHHRGDDNKITCPIDNSHTITKNNEEYFCEGCKDDLALITLNNGINLLNKYKKNNKINPFVDINESEAIQFVSAMLVDVEFMLYYMKACGSKRQNPFNEEVGVIKTDIATSEE